MGIDLSAPQHDLCLRGHWSAGSCSLPPALPCWYLRRAEWDLLQPPGWWLQTALSRETPGPSLPPTLSMDFVAGAIGGNGDSGPCRGRLFSGGTAGGRSALGGGSWRMCGLRSHSGSGQRLVWVTGQRHRARWNWGGLG